MEEPAGRCAGARLMAEVAPIAVRWTPGRAVVVDNGRMLRGQGLPDAPGVSAGARALERVLVA